MATSDNAVSGKEAPAWVSMEIIFLRPIFQTGGKPIEVVS